MYIFELFFSLNNYSCGAIVFFSPIFWVYDNSLSKYFFWVRCIFWAQKNCCEQNNTVKITFPFLTTFFYGSMWRWAVSLASQSLDVFAMFFVKDIFIWFFGFFCIYATICTPQGWVVSHLWDFYKYKSTLFIQRKQYKTFLCSQIRIRTLSWRIFVLFQLDTLISVCVLWDSTPNVLCRKLYKMKIRYLLLSTYPGQNVLYVVSTGCQG